MVDVKERVLPVTDFKYPTPGGGDEDFDSFMRRISFMMALTEAAMDILSLETLNHIDEPEAARNLVYYMLVEKDNEFDGIKIPKRELLGMEIVYFLLVGKIGPLQKSLLVTNQMLEKWKMTEEELYKIAKENTPKLFPKVLNNHADILEIRNADLPDGFPAFNKIYTCTNQTNQTGAISVFYDDMKQFFEENEGYQIYILPYSRDFMILCMLKEKKVTEGILNALKIMYESLKEDQKPLSENILFYNSLTKEIEIL